MSFVSCRDPLIVGARDFHGPRASSLFPGFGVGGQCHRVGGSPKALDHSSSESKVSPARPFSAHTNGCPAAPPIHDSSF